MPLRFIPSLFAGVSSMEKDPVQKKNPQTYCWRRAGRRGDWQSMVNKTAFSFFSLRLSSRGLKNSHTNSCSHTPQCRITGRPSPCVFISGFMQSFASKFQNLILLSSKYFQRSTVRLIVNYTEETTEYSTWLFEQGVCMIISQTPEYVCVRARVCGGMRVCMWWWKIKGERN